MPDRTPGMILSHVARLRARLLNQFFELLYGPLVFLHEPAGKLLFGEAWAARRAYVLDYVDCSGVVVDLGCGAGTLMAAMTSRGITTIGIEPSDSMRRRATRAGLDVRPGSAQSIPLPDNSFTGLVATYPGPWIFDPASWEEIERVLQPGCAWTVLLGGDYERGRWTWLRSLLVKIAYGRQGERLPTHVPPGCRLIERADRWGTASLLCCRVNA